MSRQGATAALRDGLAGWLAEEPLIAWLRAEVKDLRDEILVLRDFLSSAEILSDEAFLARLHRRRFNVAKRAHPCSWAGSIPDSFSAAGITFAALHFAGLPAAHALCAASRALCQSARVATLRLEREVPCRIYVCGGQDGQRPLSSAESFDPSTGQWEALPPMSERRERAAAVVIGRRLFVCGGYAGHQQLCSVECFDPGAGLWEVMPPMAERREGAAAAVIAGRLYICGGQDRIQLLSTMERFDPTPGRWESLPSMLQARVGAAAAASAMRLYICGGSAGQHPLSSVERFDPWARGGNGMWQNMPDMAEQRQGAAAGVLAGYVYVCGGNSGRHKWGSAERFDPLANGGAGAWETTSPMVERRKGAAASAIAGRLYVFGGHTGQQPLRSAECLDEDGSGSWEPVTSMAQRRWRAAAAVMIN